MWGSRALTFLLSILIEHKLPPRGFCTVGIVNEFCRAPTQLPPQTSSPWCWCAVCPPPNGVDSMDLAPSKHGRPYKGVGRGRCCGGVLYEYRALILYNQ